MRFINAAYDVLSQAPSTKALDDKYWNDLWKWRQGEGPPPDRTYPKGDNKARLQKVSVQFLFDDESLIAAGKSDYYDLIKIFQKLKLLRVMVNFDPVSPYDEEKEEWRTNKILIYVSSNIRSREYMMNVIRGACETYF